MRRAVMRSVAVLGLGFVLAGCNVTLPDLAGLSGGDPVPSLALVGGDVVAAGPRGYCVDAKTSRPARGLALIAACSTLAGEGALPWRNAVIAVQVGAAETALVAGGEDDLAAFVETPEGLALLSTTGTFDAIEVVDVSSRAGAVTVVFTDTNPPLIPGTQQAEWRGFVDVNGRLVTVALRGLADDPLSEDAGLSLLREAMAAVTAANPDPS